MKIRSLTPVWCSTCKRTPRKGCKVEECPWGRLMRARPRAFTWKRQPDGLQLIQAIRDAADDKSRLQTLIDHLNYQFNVRELVTLAKAITEILP